MGRILPNSKITSSNVRHYIEQATRDYSTFLNSAPTFCTYFSKNHLKSTYDRGLENINEVVGADSPIIFDQIDNVPIYKIENASFGTEITDFGVSGNVTSSAIVLPNTIVPSTDDVFEIEYQNARKVFIVTDVERDNYNNSKFFKISFKLSSFNIEDVEEQVNEEFTVDYNLIGKVDNPVIKRTDFELYLALEQIYDAVLKEFNIRFYDGEVGLYLFRDEIGRPVIDRMLNQFVLSNKLGEAYYEYRNFKYIDTSVLEEFRPTQLRKSFYRFVEEHLPAAKLIEGFKLHQMAVVPCGATRYSQDWFSKTNHYLAEPVEGSSSNYPTFEPFSADLLTLVEKNETNPENAFHSLIVRYFNEYYNKDNYSELIEHLYEFEDHADDYYVLPVVLFIIKHYRRAIIGNPNAE